MQNPGADPAFIFRGGPNSEHFLSNLRKLLKRGKFFLIYSIYKNLFLVKKTFTYLILFWVVSF